jgi:ribosomal protein S6
MEQEGKEPQVYEVGYHLIASASTPEGSKSVHALQKLIADAGGSIISEEAPKPMRLAYTFVKHVAGKNYKYDTSEFGWIKFEAAVTTAEKVKDLLSGDGNVLRHLIVKTVRENTLYGHHIAAQKAAATARAADVERREAAKKETAGPVSEAEVDKAIEDLVAE